MRKNLRMIYLNTYINYFNRSSESMELLKKTYNKIYFNHFDYFSVFIKISLIKNDILKIEKINKILF